MAEVVLEGVCKTFLPTRLFHRGDVGAEAVKNFSLAVADGELLVLVGPSGCGKTTTLRLIAGLETADRGTIRLGNQVVNQVSPRRRNVAMVFQHYALYPHLTVYENLAFGLKARSHSSWLLALGNKISPGGSAKVQEERNTIENRVHQTARLLGIESLLTRRPEELSGGERQRVALGRAIAREPAAFLLDEPLSNLDARLRMDLRRELKALHRRLRCTMIYVTHDQVEALALGDRIGVMDRGELQQVGSPEEIYDRPANRFVAGFFGSAPINFLEGALTATPQGVEFQSSGVRFCLDDEPLPPREVADQLDRPVVLGVRPEDVSLCEPAGDAGSSGAAAGARVTTVESLGDSSLVQLEIEAADGEARLLAKVEAKTTLRLGDIRDVVFRRSRVHWFDGRTGERLAAFPSAPAFTA